MNTYGLLAGLLIMAGLGSWAVWERGDAEKWHADYTTLQASYSLAAQQAKDDAAATEARDMAALKSQSSQALQQAQSSQLQAQQELIVYQKRLKEASGAKDLPHLCAGVPVPPDLIPAP